MVRPQEDLEEGRKKNIANIDALFATRRTILQVDLLRSPGLAIKTFVMDNSSLDLIFISLCNSKFAYRVEITPYNHRKISVNRKN